MAVRPDLLPFPEDSREKLRDAFNGAEIVDGSTPEKMRKRMAELREMGFEDIPWKDGIRSSMRVYAESSIIVEEKRKDDDEPEVFVTRDKKLIERSAELAARFHLRPITFDEMQELQKTAKNPRMMVSIKTIIEAAEVAARELAAAQGDPNPNPDVLAELAKIIKDRMLREINAKGIEIGEGSPGSNQIP